MLKILDLLQRNGYIDCIHMRVITTGTHIEGCIFKNYRLNIVLQRHLFVKNLIILFLIDYVIDMCIILFE